MTLCLFLLKWANRLINRIMDHMSTSKILFLSLSYSCSSDGVLRWYIREWNTHDSPLIIYWHLQPLIVPFIKVNFLLYIPVQVFHCKLHLSMSFRKRFLQNSNQSYVRNGWILKHLILVWCLVLARTHYTGGECRSATIPKWNVPLLSISVATAALWVIC